MPVLVAGRVGMHEDACLRFGLLGPLTVTLGDTEVELARRQERLVLARLLVTANQTVSADRLVDDLWGDAPPSTASSSLHALVSRLRRALEPGRVPGAGTSVLARRPPGYVLQVPPDAIDMHRFEARTADAAAHAAAGRHGDAVLAYDEALSLWRGAVLADLADEPFVAPVAARLAALRVDARERRAASLLASGAAVAAIADLELLVAEDELRQRPWRLLLLALHGAGRTVEALERLRQVRSRLADELGLDLGPELQAVEAQLLRGEPLPSPPPDPIPLPLPSPVPEPPPAAVVAADTSVPTDATTGTAPDTGQLLGRDTERAELEATLRRACSGRTCWAVLLGDAGIGKTTLADDVAARGAALGARAVHGRCHEAALAPAFWPWMQALRTLDDLVPGAATLLQELDDEDGDPAARLFSRFDRIAEVLRTATAVTPLVLVLEDVHWADEESLQLVDFLAIHLRDEPLLIVLTSRRDEGGPSLSRTLADLARHPGHVRIEVTGLDRSATAELAARISGDTLDVASVEALQARTGGNPFFVTELARSTGRGDGALTLPDTVRELLVRRLSCLEPDAAALLTLAAVHGAEFHLDALTATSDHDEGRVCDLVDELLTTGLLVPGDGPARFRFSHALVREAALGELPDLRRRRLHLRIATALQALAPDDPTAWHAEVAHHLLAAAPLGDPRVSLDAARAAAELAQGRLAFHEAAGWWTGALRVLEWDRTLGADLRLRYELLVAAGNALADGGDRPAALDRLADAIDVAEELGDVEAMARAAVGFERTCGAWYWTAYGSARPQELLERIHRTLAALGPDADPLLRVRVLAVSAAGEYYGDQARGRAYAAEARDIAARTDDPETRAWALVASVRISWHHGALDGLTAWSDELLAIAQEHRLYELELLAWTYRMAWGLIRGDLHDAEHAYRSATRLADQLGLKTIQAQLAWSGAIFPLAAGDLDTAERLLEGARERHAQIRLYALDHVWLWNRVPLLWDTGRLHELTAAERELVSQLLPEGEVAVRAADGDVVGAATLLRELCATPPLPDIFDQLGTTVLRARAAVELGLVDLAGALHDELAPHEDRLAAIGTCAPVWPVALELGRLRRLLGRDHDARTTFVAVAARARAAGWTRWAETAEAELGSLDGELAAPAGA